MNAFSSVKALQCITCGRSYALGPMLEGCPDCRAAGRVAMLDPVYTYDTVDAAAFESAGVARLWAYHLLLPVRDEGAVVTLGEGATPLLPLVEVAAEVGAAEVWLKYEAVNPTHSFKDRANAVAVAAARCFGFTKVLCASTGNHGVALAAYAARASMRCLILLPSGAPPAAAREMRFFGADVVTITGGNVIPLMFRLWREHGWYISQRNAPGTGGRPFGNPFGMEGYKTIAFEIFHQLARRPPDRVFIPVGGGDSAWGLYKGFDELRRLGITARLPRIMACQAAAGAPLAHALRLGLPRVEPVTTSSTIAFSIVDSHSGDHALLAIRQSAGGAVAVDDRALLDAETTLQRMGICVEPSSAASLAALRRFVQNGGDLTGETVVLIGTGAGQRWPATFSQIETEAPVVPGSVSALAQVVAL